MPPVNNEKKIIENPFQGKLLTLQLNINNEDIPVSLQRELIFSKLLKGGANGIVCQFEYTGNDKRVLEFCATGTTTDGKERHWMILKTAPENQNAAEAFKREQDITDGMSAKHTDQSKYYAAHSGSLVEDNPLTQKQRTAVIISKPTAYTFTADGLPVMSNIESLFEKVRANQPGMSTQEQSFSAAEQSMGAAVASDLTLGLKILGDLHLALQEMHTGTDEQMRAAHLDMDLRNGVIKNYSETNIEASLIDFGFGQFLEEGIGKETGQIKPLAISKQSRINGGASEVQVSYADDAYAERVMMLKMMQAHFNLENVVEHPNESHIKDHHGNELTNTNPAIIALYTNKYGNEASLKHFVNNFKNREVKQSATASIQKTLFESSFESYLTCMNAVDIVAGASPETIDFAKKLDNRLREAAYTKYALLSLRETIDLVNAETSPAQLRQSLVAIHRLINLPINQEVKTALQAMCQTALKINLHSDYITREANSVYQEMRALSERLDHFPEFNLTTDNKLAQQQNQYFLEEVFKKARSEAIENFGSSPYSNKSINYLMDAFHRLSQLPIQSPMLPSVSEDMCKKIIKDQVEFVAKYIHDTIVRYHATENKNPAILTELLLFIRNGNWSTWIKQDENLYKICILLKENLQPDGTLNERFKQSDIYHRLFELGPDSANLLLKKGGNEQQKAATQSAILQEIETTLETNFNLALATFTQHPNEKTAFALTQQANDTTTTSVFFSQSNKKNRVYSIFAENNILLEETPQSMSHIITKMKQEAHLYQTAMNDPDKLKMFELVSFNNFFKILSSNKQMDYRQTYARIVDSNRSLSKPLIELIKRKDIPHTTYLIALQQSIVAEANRLFENGFTTALKIYRDKQSPTEADKNDLRLSLQTLLSLPTSNNTKDSAAYLAAKLLTRYDDIHDEMQLAAPTSPSAKINLLYLESSEAIKKAKEQELDALIGAPLDKPITDDFLLMSLHHQMTLNKHLYHNDEIVKEKLEAADIFKALKLFASETLQKSPLYKGLFPHQENQQTGNALETLPLAAIYDLTQLEIDKLFIINAKKILDVMPGEKSVARQLIEALPLFKSPENPALTHELSTRMTQLLQLPVSPQMKSSALYKNIEDTYQSDDHMIDLGSDAAWRDNARDTKKALYKTTQELFTLQFNLSISDYRQLQLHANSSIDDKHTALIPLRNKLLFLFSLGPIALSAEFKKSNLYKTADALLRVVATELQKSDTHEKVITDKFNRVEAMIKDLPVTTPTHLTPTYFTTLVYEKLNSYHISTKTREVTSKLLTDIYQLLQRPTINDLTNMPLYQTCQLLTSHFITDNKAEINDFVEKNEKRLRAQIEAIPDSKHADDYSRFIVNTTELELSINQNDQTLKQHLSTLYTLPISDHADATFGNSQFMRELHQYLQTASTTNKASLKTETTKQIDAQFLEQTPIVLRALANSTLQSSPMQLFGRKSSTTHIGELVQALDNLMALPLSDETVELQQLLSGLHTELLTLKNDRDKSSTHKWDVPKFNKIKAMLQDSSGLIAEFDAILTNKFIAHLKISLQAYQQSLLISIDQSDPKHKEALALTAKSQLLRDLAQAMTLPVSETFKQLPNGIYDYTKTLITDNPDSFRDTFDSLSALVNIPDTVTDHLKRLYLTLQEQTLYSDFSALMSVIKQYYELELSNDALIKNNISDLTATLKSPPLNELSTAKAALIAKQALQLSSTLANEYEAQANTQETQIARRLAIELANTFDALAAPEMSTAMRTQRLRLGFQLTHPTLPNIEAVINAIHDKALAAFVTDERKALLTELQTALATDLTLENNKTTLVEKIIAVNKIVSETRSIEASTLTQQFALLAAHLGLNNISPIAKIGFAQQMAILSATPSQHFSLNLKLHQLDGTIYALTDDSVITRVTFQQALANMMKNPLPENAELNNAINKLCILLSNPTYSSKQVINALCELEYLALVKSSENNTVKQFAADLDGIISDSMQNKSIMPDTYPQLLRVQAVLKQHPDLASEQVKSVITAQVSTNQTFINPIEISINELSHTLAPLDKTAFKAKADALMTALLQHRELTLKFSLEMLPTYPGAAIKGAQDALNAFIKAPFPGNAALQQAAQQVLTQLNTLKTADPTSISSAQEAVSNLKSLLTSPVAASLSILSEQLKQAAILSATLNKMCVTLENLPKAFEYTITRDTAMNVFMDETTGSLKFLSLAETKEAFFKFEKAMLVTHPADMKPTTPEQQAAVNNYKEAMAALRDTLHISTSHIIDLPENDNVTGAKKIKMHITKLEQVPNTQTARDEAKMKIINELSGATSDPNAPLFKSEQAATVPTETNLDDAHALVTGSTFSSGDAQFIKTDEFFANTDTKRLEILTSFTNPTNPTIEAMNAELDKATQSVRIGRFGDKVTLPSAMLLDEFAKTVATSLDKSASLRILRELDVVQNVNQCNSDVPAKAYALCLQLANFKVRWNTAIHLSEKETKAFDYWIKKQIKDNTLTPGLMALLAYTKYKEHLPEMVNAPKPRPRGQTV